MPVPYAWHGYVAAALLDLLGPPADAAGLVGTTPFNLGAPDDYRVPDGGFHRSVPSELFVAAAAIVVEVVAPHDETWDKLGFYARHGVGEICIADPLDRSIRWFVLAGDACKETGASPLLGLTGAELAARIDWPG